MDTNKNNGWNDVSYIRMKLRKLDFAYEDARQILGSALAEAQYQRMFCELQDELAKFFVVGLMTKQSYDAHLSLFSTFYEAHQKVREQQEVFDRAAVKQLKEEIEGLAQPPKKKAETSDEKPMFIRHTCTEGTYKYRTPEERKNIFTRWGLLTPRNLEKYPMLEMAKGRFVAPETIDLRDYCTRTTDQGSKPWCAAYAAAGFVSNIIWRKEDIPPTIDAAPLYEIAKELDGEPNTDGTTLTAIYQAVLDKGYFDDTMCSVKVLRNKEQVKYAVHKFGCCLLGMMVTKEWYYCNRNKTTISGKDPTTNTPIGGHAVLCCGYNPDGIIIQNSWGVDWGSYGFALVTWDEFEREFSYGAVMDNCLFGTKMN